MTMMIRITATLLGFTCKSLVVSTHELVDTRTPRRRIRGSSRSLQELTLTAFGEDLNPDLPRAPLTEFPNSVAARDEFFALFTNVETEDFESFDLDTRFPIVSTAFETVGDATLTGSNQARIAETGSNEARRYATSGTRYLDMNAREDFFLTLPQPIVGFGFFATDIGDVLGTLAVETSLNGGSTKRYVVPHTVGRGRTGADGAVIYVGILDYEGFDQVRFDLVQEEDRNDNFGFDDFSVMAPEQITASAAPSRAPSGMPSLAPSISTSPSLMPSSVPTIALTSESPSDCSYSGGTRGSSKGSSRGSFASRSGKGGSKGGSKGTSSCGLRSSGSSKSGKGRGSSKGSSRSGKGRSSSTSMSSSKSGKGGSTRSSSSER